MASGLAQELAQSLRWASPGDRAEHPLADDVAVRVRLEPDDMTTLDDWGDCYGTFEFVNDRYGQGQRPSGFDGNAEKLCANGGDPMWWQPPADVKRTDPSFAEFRRIVLELLEFGWVGVIVERLEGEDDYGHGIVRDHASLWGIESMVKPDYLAEVIDDLLVEVGIERVEA